METKIIINSQQIVKIWITPAIPVNDLNKLFEGIGHWEWKEYKTVKKLFRKPFEVYAPGWYMTPTISYDGKKKYIPTDEELMSYLKEKYAAKYMIQDKVLYRCMRAVITFSNDGQKYIYFDNEMDCDNFLNEIYTTTPSLKDITKYHNI